MIKLNLALCNLKQFRMWFVECRHMQLDDHSLKMYKALEYREYAYNAKDLIFGRQPKVLALIYFRLSGPGL